MTDLLAHPRCCCHHGPGGCPAQAGLPSSPLLASAHWCAGCTLTAAVLSGDVLTVAHVGDSAAVLDCGAEVVGLTTGVCPCRCCLSQPCIVLCGGSGMARVWAVQPATQQAQVRVGSTGACASAPCPCTHANNQCPPAPLPSRAPHRQLPLRAGAAGGCRRPPQPVEPVRQRAVVRHARGGGPCAPVAGGHHGGAGHRRPGCGRHPAATPPHLPGGVGIQWRRACCSG